jgi:hypothetical protein
LRSLRLEQETATKERRLEQDSPMFLAEAKQRTRRELSQENSRVKTLLLLQARD